MSRFNQANQLLREKKHNESIKIYQSLLQNAPSHLSRHIRFNLEYAESKLGKKGGDAPQASVNTESIVSLITPSYNSEAFIYKTLSSVASQSLSNYEHIVVDDGSTDSSPRIIRDFASRDSRVKYVRKANGGFATAINTGIAESKSDYICFVEADDWIDSDSLQTHYDTIVRHDADFTRSLFRVHHSSEKVSLDNYIRRMNLPVDQPVNIFSHPNICIAQLAYWTGIYKKNFLLDNQIYLYDDHQIPLYQDTILNYKMFLSARRIVFFEECFYNYNALNENEGQSIKNKKYPTCVERLFERMDRWREMKGIEISSEVDFAIKSLHLGFHLKRVELSDQFRLFRIAKRILGCIATSADPARYLSDDYLKGRALSILQGSFEPYYNKYIKQPGSSYSERSPRRVIVMQFFPVYSIQLLSIFLKDKFCEIYLLTDKNNKPSYEWSQIIAKKLPNVQQYDVHNLSSLEPSEIRSKIGAIDDIFINFTDFVGYRKKILDAYPDIPVSKIIHGISDYYEKIPQELEPRIAKYYSFFDFGSLPSLCAKDRRVAYEIISRNSFQDALNTACSDQIVSPSISHFDPFRTVLFLHQNLSTNGIIAPDKEYELYEESLASIISAGYQVIFKPHYYPQEIDYNKLFCKFSEDQLHIVLDMGFPVEAYSTWIENNVSKVCSFFSSALFTLSSYGIDCYSINLDKMSSNLKAPNIKVLYHNFISLQLVAIRFPDILRGAYSQQSLISIFKSVQNAQMAH